ncbi:PREDICTED: 2-carboxy-1,4-naphthoquinone phytyltransferase, chloroplastic isoform X2 [Nelumbo nucifera]|uniref:2-carboxy-1,4-naphthoquinone phytyltransferase, chloroplastic isoform X2 n=1 Tax=Nelumbo nucifera TaxID=4432 RepID=A0A1U8AW47_NELNU|nr:PREDICTED: 2-carboxy-1,4-naphthoquinone phytyltransferase, chloroplastic isoform X2 [Nelumbo nucifera]
MASVSALSLPSVSSFAVNLKFLMLRAEALFIPNAVKTSSQFCYCTQPPFKRKSGIWSKDKFCHWRREAYESEEGRSFTTQNEEAVPKEDEISRATLIWRAIKLPIYSVAIVPLTVGSAVAYLQTGLFFARRYLMLLFSSVFIITWLNLSNDVYDFDTGADKNKKESVVNMVDSRTGTLVSAYMLLVIGFMGLTWASVEAGNIRSILLLICAITCGYIYQCPPFRLSYQGLGEPLCFAAFGPFATTAFYLLQSSRSNLYHLPLTGTILSASLLVGFTTSLILFCSHFHQVRIGTKKGSLVVKVAIVTLYLLLFTLGLSKALPLTCILLCALTLPIGKLVVSYVEENHTDSNKIFMAKYYCVRLHALFGAALAAGLVATRTVAKAYVPKPFFS